MTALLRGIPRRRTAGTGCPAELRSVPGCEGIDIKPNMGGLPTARAAVFEGRFRSDRNVRVTRYGSRTVLHHTVRNRYYTLNCLAGRVWNLLDRGASLHTILQLLRREYGAPFVRLEAELAAVVERLLAIGLIEMYA